MGSESQLLSDIIRALYPWVKLWRCNVGSVRTADGRRFSTGLPKGHPDLYGTIDQRLTGYPTSVPVYIECKVDGRGATPEQAAFLAAEIAKGSIAGVCCTVEDALALVVPHLRPWCLTDDWRGGYGEKDGAMDPGGCAAR